MACCSHLGVGNAVPVVVDLESGLDAVVAALATARIGGVVTTTDHPARRWWWCRRVRVSLPRDGSVSSAATACTEPDLDWEVMLRAGRTDPAACEVLEPAAAYSPERSVAEQIDRARRIGPAVRRSRARGLLQV